MKLSRAFSVRPCCTKMWPIAYKSSPFASSQWETLTWLYHMRCLDPKWIYLQGLTIVRMSIQYFLKIRQSSLPISKLQVNLPQAYIWPQMILWHFEICTYILNATVKPDQGGISKLFLLLLTIVRQNEVSGSLKLWSRCSVVASCHLVITLHQRRLSAFNSHNTNSLYPYTTTIQQHLQRQAT